VNLQHRQQCALATFKYPAAQTLVAVSWYANFGIFC